MKQYVVGFLFNHHRKEVALIGKKRPHWQFGKLNGIGGKIELGESVDKAMVREFKEETGCNVLSWRRYCRLKAGDSTVFFFVANDGEFHKLESQTDELVKWYSIEKVLNGEYNIIPNLIWLIPLALDESIKLSLVYENN